MNQVVIRINLTAKTFVKQELPYEVLRSYMGGDLLGAYFLMKETEPGIDPLSEKSMLLFMTSPLTGVKLSGTGRHSIIAKSPLTGGIAASQSGGYWGATLKKAGYLGLIITGQSDKPCYINIKDDLVEILDGASLWGLNMDDADRVLKTLHGKGVKSCIIGPAGENLVDYACIGADLHHFAGRGGLGAVMGSKNLKAVAVQGSQDIVLHDEDTFKEIKDWFHKGTKEHPAISVHHEYGTAKGVVPMSVGGMLPTRNFQDGSFEGAEAISGKALKEIGTKSGTCFSCVVACKRKIKPDPEAGIAGTVGGPEFESIGSLGSALGVDSIKAVVKSNELCNQLGIDTISAGMTIAWAIECFERGLITTEDTGGIVLDWNQPEIIQKLLYMITNKEGFGKILSLGSRKAAGVIGKDTIRYAMQSKGQEFPGHEPRPKWSVALGYAVSPTGADHLQAAHDPWFEKEGEPDREWGFVDLYDLAPLGLLDPEPSQSLSPRKVRMFTYLQHMWGLHDVLDICIFVTAPEFRAIDMDKINLIVQSVTGWNTSLFELMKVGERWVTLLRAYNLREGLTSDDDSLPERCFEPIRSGTSRGVKIDRDQFLKSLSLYYGMMGWDNKGIPTEAKLEELNLGWVLEQLKSVGLA